MPEPTPALTPGPVRRSRHAIAIQSTQGLLGIVAGLGITNTMDVLIKNTPVTMIHLTSFTTSTASRARDLGLGRYVPFILAIFQIIIALRFYQSTTILIEDRYPTLLALPANPSTKERKTAQAHFVVQVIGAILEGIIVAADSFYIHYPHDFIYLLSILFLMDSLLTFSRIFLESYPHAGVNRCHFFWEHFRQLLLNQDGWWFCFNALLGLFLVVWYGLFGHLYVVFFAGVVAAIGVNTLVVVYGNLDGYFPLS